MKGFTRGKGSPVNTVVGSPGDLYLDTNGGNGVTLWVKDSGVNDNTGWKSVDTSATSAAGGLTPPTNGAWSQALWAVDPANSTGVASDSNAGSLAAPMLTWRGVVARLGTTSPIIRQNTRIVFLSSHVDNSDPVIFTPIHMDGFTTSIEGNTPAVASAGIVLAGTTAKSSAAGANSLLITTLNATAAVNSFLRNTTAGKVSRAWAYKSLGANSFSITQPLVPCTVQGTASPAEMDTWANGDTVDILTPIAINIALYEPDISSSTFTNTFGYIYQCQILGATECRLGAFVRLYEVLATRQLQFTGVGGGSGFFFSNVLTNVVTAGGMVGSAVEVDIVAGATKGSISSLACGRLDGDHIMGASTLELGLASGNTSAPGNLLGRVFLDGNIVSTGLTLVKANAYGTFVVYGAAGKSINMQGKSRLVLPGGTFVAAFTAPALIAPGILLNGGALGHSVISGAPDVLNGNIATTPANLDAAAGAAGFGGLAFNLGGASIGQTA